MINRKKRKGYLEYVARVYGFSFVECRELWNEAEQTFRDRTQTNELVRDLGFKNRVSDQFFFLAASKMNDESEQYYCVNGCCIVLWHPKRGNHGGFGPAGCSCDELDDPRGPDPKLIQAA